MIVFLTPNEISCHSLYPLLYSLSVYRTAESVFIPLPPSPLHLPHSEFRRQHANLLIRRANHQILTRGQPQNIFWFVGFCFYLTHDHYRFSLKPTESSKSIYPWAKITLHMTSERNWRFMAFWLARDIKLLQINLTFCARPWPPQETALALSKKKGHFLYGGGLAFCICNMQNSCM